MRRRLALVVLACSLVVTGVLPGGLGIALAIDEPADLVQVVDTTTTFVPSSPGPSGVAYRSDTNTLIVVDSDRSVSGFDGFNLYEYSLTTGLIVYAGNLPLTGALDDATGVAYDGATGTLFVSSDSSSSVYLIHAGADGKFGVGGDDGAVTQIEVANDTEDPAFNPVNGHLYVLDGADGLVYDIDPVLNGFGDLDDTITPFGIPFDPSDPGGLPDDWEGLAFDPVSQNLIAGAKFDNQIIYEFTTAGVYVQQHDTSSLTDLQQISGLGTQPAVGDYPVTYWIADRGVETSGSAGMDGKLFRVTFGPAPVLPPAAPVLGAITTPITVNEGTLVTFDVNATDPNIADTLTFSLDPGGPTGDAINASSGVYTWTPGEADGGQPAFTARVRVTDNGTSPLDDFQDVSITVNEVNSSPVITGGPFAPLHGEGEAVIFDMHGTDSDLPAQTKTWSASGLPPGLGINTATGRISGTVSAGATSGSPYSVQVTLSDGVTQDTENFQWTIQNTNPHAPVLGNITNKTVTRNAQLSFNASATDADSGDFFTFSLVSPPSGASITAGGHFTWTPSQTPGNYNVTVRVSDDGSPIRSDQQTFVVTIQAVPPVDTNPFVDDDGHVFENAIEWLDSQGITSGCNPPVNDRFCPDDFVTRGQMAAFLVRALHYSDGGNVNYFIDDNGHVFENAINRLRTAGVTQGCNPPTNNRYCPNALVTRGQMAAFLVRAFGYTAGGSTNYFIDDNGSPFETAINRLRTAGVTQGCNPPVNDRYCPNDRVTHGQMAAFLKRALDG